MVTTTESAAQLLAHEATRVFHDRLVDDGDRMRFFEFLADDLHNYFKVRMFWFLAVCQSFITVC